MKYLFAVICLCSSAACFTQDLSIISYAGEKTFDRYQSFQGTFTFHNSGIVPTEKAVVYFYFSEDTEFSYSDQWAYRYELSPMEPGESREVPILTWYGIETVNAWTNVIVLIDHWEDIPETDRTNNVFVVENIEVTPADFDLTIDSLHLLPYDYWLDPPSLPEVWHPSEPLMLEFIVRNNGTTDLGGYAGLEILFSNDEVPDESDRLLSTEAYFLHNIDSRTHLRVDIPHDAEPGHYYIIASVNKRIFRLDEPDTLNNMATIKLEIQPNDIDVTSDPSSDIWMDLDSTTSYSPLMRLQVNPRNLGSTTAGRFKCAVYFSADSILSTDDFKFMEAETFGATPGQWQWHESLYFFSFLNERDVYALQSGDYFVIVRLNSDSAMYETDYSNNIVVSTKPLLHLADVEPVIQVSGFVAQQFFDTDLYLPFNIVFKNTGVPQNEAFSFPFRITLKSKNGNLIASNEQSAYIDLSKTDSTIWSSGFLLDEMVKPGEYYFEIMPLSRWSLDSLVTLPLFVIEPAKYWISGVVQGEEGQAIYAGKLFLYRKHDDGTVSFINKTVLSGNNFFQYNVNSNPHTLFFIPDPVIFPDFVPTILGKTVTLGPENFFSIDHHVDTVFQILKSQGVGTGTKSITGNIFNPSTGGRKSGAGRVQELGESVEGFPVVLLSSSGEPLKVVTTDSLGNFQFSSLPEASYQVVVALELDQPGPREPIAADVTIQDVVIEVNLSGDQPVFSKHKQEFHFEPLPEKMYGDANFKFEVISSSDLPVTLSISDTSVAKIVDGQIHIANAGLTEIVAVQPGNEFYVGHSATIPFQVKKGTQTISFGELQEIPFDSSTFTLNGTATSGLPVTFVAQNPNVVIVEGNLATIVGIGTGFITASQDGNHNFEAAPPVRREIRVKKMPESKAVRIDVFPTRVSDIVKISSDAVIRNVSLYDIAGKLQGTILWEGESADMSALAAGVYFLKVETDVGTAIRKVTKN